MYGFARYTCIGAVTVIFVLAFAGIGIFVFTSARSQVILSRRAFVTAVKEKGISGAVFAVCDGRRPQIELAGYSNLERRRRVTQQTVFAAGSLGKPLFAYAVLDFANRGRIDLDQPLKDYLPHYFHQQNPERGGTSIDEVTDPHLNPVTARMVLSHTSGLPNWSRHGDLAFSFNPGTRWQYSGEGYIYLQRVIEKLTSEPLETWMEETVFTRIGMTQTHFAVGPVSRDLLATGYGRDNHAIAISEDQQALAPSTLLTTIGDYSRFVTTLVARHSEAWLKPMFYPYARVDPKLGLFWTVGLACEITPQHQTYFHWGANPGFQSLMWMDPNSNRWLVLLTNSEHGLELADWAVPRVFPGPHPALRFPMLHPAD